MIDVHAQSPDGNDIAFCGLAYDAFLSGDTDEEVVIAKPGQTVTCAHCRRVIDYGKTFTGYRQR